MPGGGGSDDGGELRQKLFKIYSSMEAENAVCRQGRYFMLKAYLMQMMLLVIREQCEPVERMGGYAFESVNKKYIVEQMVNYFEDHYSEKISLDQIAENMYLSPFYISKIFKSETGDTPIRHLINIRGAYRRSPRQWDMMTLIISVSYLKRDMEFRRRRQEKRHKNKRRLREQ